MRKCRICGEEDQAVVIIPNTDRPLAAHAKCFIDWAKRVLEIVAERDAMFSKNERVEVIGIGFGTIFNVRADDRGEAIYDVELDSPEGTSTGFFIARVFELRRAA